MMRFRMVMSCLSNFRDSRCERIGVWKTPIASCGIETWLSAEIPNEAIEPAGFSVQCVERTKDLSGKGKGVGVCFMINNAWCDQWNVRFIESFCSPDLEYLIISCIALWLLREISGAIVTIVYMAPQADTDLVLGKLYEAVKSHGGRHHCCWGLQQSKV
ncbi:hypothetical protein MHYP_G00307980 [Metynnis hypsauchen]